MGRESLPAVTTKGRGCAKDGRRVGGGSWLVAESDIFEHDRSVCAGRCPTTQPNEGTR